MQGDQGTRQRLSRSDPLNLYSTGPSSPSFNIYNVADDLPSPRDPVLRFAFELLKIQAPEQLKEQPLEPPRPTSSRRSRKDSKRVANQKIKQELGVVLKYPTFKEGLPAVLRSELRS